MKTELINGYLINIDRVDHNHKVEYYKCNVMTCGIPCRTTFIDRANLLEHLKADHPKQFQFMLAKADV